MCLLVTLRTINGLVLFYIPTERYRESRPVGISALLRRDVTLNEAESDASEQFNRSFGRAFLVNTNSHDISVGP